MDFCCGASMIGRLAPLHTEGGALVTDVPFLYCHTCGLTVVAPEIEFDVTMFAHYCDTDGVKSASLFDVIDKERILSIIEEYSTDSGTFEYPYVISEQLDHMLDLWNFAADIGDDEWRQSIKETLLLLHKVRSEQRLPQGQI